jgi:hypothetical protein
MVRGQVRLITLVAPVLGAVLLAGCGGAASAAKAGQVQAAAVDATVPGSTAAAAAAPAGPTPTLWAPTSTPASRPANPPAARSTVRAARPASAGNPAGRAAVPAEAGPVLTGGPVRVVGTGTPTSCTSAAVVAAVAKGGRISFKCGARPVTIVMAATAKVVNTSPLVVLDGGGLVTLSGGGKRRILYLDTCDQKQIWTTSHCNDQQSPKLVVQNLAFADGNATGQHEEGGGGGAILARGGQFRAYNTRFLRNRCDSTGPDLGGAAIRVLDQWQDRPVYVTNSTFGGAAGQGGVCSNGGALSSIGVSWTVLNSVLSYNSAIGVGANPARPGTPGGGSGGAIYNDGNTMALKLDGTLVEHNSAKEGGGAVFFVSNDLTGTLRIARSTLRVNPNAGFHTQGFPGIFYLGLGKPVVIDSTIG